MHQSAGIIPFRKNENNEVEFFVGHPGGVKWETIDYWTFMKGGVEGNESWVEAAIREFKEETGLKMEWLKGEMLIPLGSTMQNHQKMVIAYGLEYADIYPSECYSNMASNGLNPEVDRYKWMTMKEIEKKTHETHLIFYKKLADYAKYRDEQGFDI